MGTQITQVKGRVQERSKVKLLRALLDLHPDSQEARAAAVGVGQSSLQRWEAELEERGDFTIGPSSLIKLRLAVERAEKAAPSERDAGVLEAVEAVEATLDALRRRLGLPAGRKGGRASEMVGAGLRQGQRKQVEGKKK